MHCNEVAARQSADVRAKLEDLNLIEGVLSKLVSEYRAHRSNVSCPLIAALHVSNRRYLGER